MRSPNGWKIPHWVSNNAKISVKSEEQKTSCEAENTALPDIVATVLYGNDYNTTAEQQQQPPVLLKAIQMVRIQYSR